MPEITCPTPEKIRAAAEKSSEAKAVLKELFPEAFVTEGLIHLKTFDLVSTRHMDTAKFQIRASGKYADYGVFLTAAFNWEIVEDEEEEKVLIARRKP